MNVDNLKAQLELIRGREIPFRGVAPSEIPCIETSDESRLCRDPLVSVCMITYNHELYIRQAIEGVLMQQTDFEYELVIGEDCSSDRTRAICMEYQQRFPGHVRVLWAHENVHRRGGNGTRTLSRCRGEYIAFCEGDDYWIDPLKLQKQIDAFRHSSTVGICITGARILNQHAQTFSDYPINVFPVGVVPGREFLRIHGFSRTDANFIMTATVMVKTTVLRRVTAQYEIFSWCLAVGDTTIWEGMATMSDAYVLADQTAVYRRTSTGAMATNGAMTDMDGTLTRLFYSVRCLRVDIFTVTSCFADVLAIDILHLAKILSPHDQRERMREILRNGLTRTIFANPMSWPGLILMGFGLLNARTARRAGQIIYHVGRIGRGWRIRRCIEAMFP